MPKPDRTIKSFGDDVYNSVRIAGVDIQMRMAVRQFRKYQRKMRRAEG